MYRAAPPRVLHTRGTAGVREVGNVNAAWGLGILFLWAGLGRSEVLWWCLALAIWSQLYHRFCARRNADTHTHFIGESEFTRFLPPGAARAFEVALAAGLGVALRGYDLAASNYFLAAGAGHAATLAFAHHKRQAVNDDLNDAMIEAQSRTESRQPGHRPRRPWESDT